MTYNKSTFAKFPSKTTDGEKINNKKNVTKINNKRQLAINQFRPHPPANNGWWYYQMFSKEAFSRAQKPRKK